MNHASNVVLIGYRGTGKSTVGRRLARDLRRYLVSTDAEVVKRAKLPRIRLHDLRHTCATLLLIKGVHPKYV